MTFSGPATTRSRLGAAIGTACLWAALSLGCGSGVMVHGGFPDAAGRPDAVDGKPDGGSASDGGNHAPQGKTDSGQPPSDTTPPTISITCPASGTYSSQRISVSGTASDGVSVSGVQVQVDSGPWQTATGTTSWSIAELDLGSSGPHTVTARATDTAGNTKETSIAVRYSTSAPSGALKFDGTFKLGDGSIDKNHWSSTAWGAPLYNSCIPRADSLTVVQDPEGIRGWVGKYTIRYGDSCNTPAGLNNRVALAKPQYNIDPGTEEWYAESIYFTPFTGDAGSKWWMFFQIEMMYNVYGGGYPTIALYRENGKLTIRWDEINVAAIGTFPSTGWNDFLLNIKWSTTNTGFIKVYNNKVLIWEKYNIKTQPLRNGQPVIVHELDAQSYRGEVTSTYVDYRQFYRAGTTRAAVEYGSSSGNPAPRCTAR